MDSILTKEKDVGKQLKFSFSEWSKKMQMIHSSVLSNQILQTLTTKGVSNIDFFYFLLHWTER